MRTRAKPGRPGVNLGMKKLIRPAILAGVALAVLAIGLGTATGGHRAAAAKPPACTTIQSGTLAYPAGHYLAGQPLTTGYDAFGYNYQAHQFAGSYANVYLGRAGFPPYDGDDAGYLLANPAASAHWAWPYRSIQLVMKWNDAWISNVDCDGDGSLDRHYGFASYVGSGAWETNHMWDDDGGHWSSFTKIVAVPATATNVGGTWYGASGNEIGPDIWGEFAIVLDVLSGEGTLYRSPSGPGFGHFD